MNNSFLPTSLEEGREYYANKGTVDWANGNESGSFEQFDVIFITGDPYYDHPLSGMSMIARLLDAKGYRVGIVAQPQTDVEFMKCGKPRYFFCITSGLLDSMLANYTPMLRQRENVLVPQRGLMVYTQKVKELYKGCITVIGGVEATIRRFTHFDYKENKLRRGILNDTKAEMLLFGNAERAILTLLSRMKELEKERGKNICEERWEVVKEGLDLFSIDGVGFRIKKEQINPRVKELPSYEVCVADGQEFNTLTRMTYLLPDNAFIEPCGMGLILQNRPAHVLREQEMDFIYELPYTRQLHPASKNYEFNLSMVEKLETSVIIGRGCWGSCWFCVIPLVQGKEVATRSKESIVKEIETLYKNGVRKINDLTLPTLNMYGSRCSLYDEAQEIDSPIIAQRVMVYNKTKYCNQQCVGCPKRVISDDLIPVLDAVRELNRKYSGTSMELRSAIRHDIILEQKQLFREIMKFVSRLKIAPEHISDTVLKQMNKANRGAFEEFLKEYALVNKEQGTKKNLVPYFVAAHPGSTMNDMELLRQFCEEKDIFVNLTQVFTPTPGTVSTAMYYTGENPLTKEKVYVPRGFREKKDQKNVLVSGYVARDYEGNIVDENA